MDFDDLLKQQQAWLDRAGEALKRPGTPVATAELALQRKARIEGMNAAVERLTRQRDETVRRFDAAIAEERNALKRLQEESAKDEKKTTRPVQSRRPTPPAPAKGPKPKGKGR